MKYEDQLRHPKWLAFRKDVYKRARFRCQLCGKQNVGLEAHHSYYESDKMAWEYPIESVIALCNTCHSEKAHGKPSEELLLAQFETQHVRDQLQFSESLYKQFIAYLSRPSSMGALIFPTRTSRRSETISSTSIRMTTRLERLRSLGLSVCRMTEASHMESQFQVGTTAKVKFGRWSIL